MAANKKVILISIFATLLVAGGVVAAVIFVNKHNENNNNNKNKNITATKKTAEELCSNTYYYQSCIGSLSKAENSSDPIDLIRVGFKSAIEELGNVIKKSGPFQEAAKDDRTAEAYKLCQKLLDDSIYDIQRTSDRTYTFKESDFKILLDDVKTWLSGALAFQETCLDTLKEVNVEAAAKMEEMMKLSRELTLNGLALTDQFSRFIVKIGGGGRRLLADGSGKTRRLLQATPQTVKPNVVVAQDGSGKYKTIAEALKEAPRKKNDTFVIYIKEGVYQEYVLVAKDMWSVMFLGDGPTKTKITGSKSVEGSGGSVTTFQSSTVSIEGDNFIAKDIGFENTAGAINHQAVALRVTADKTIFHNCQIDGYQDTLYAHSHRQYYRDCTISGTIDFIFGDARAIFQNCTMLVRKPLPQQACMVTAQGRTENNETTGIVLQNCQIKPDADYPVGDANYKTYLGRPWKDFSRTVIMKSNLDGFIAPEGWSPWNSSGIYQDTCWYAEVDNNGPGADLTRRAKWPGIKKISIDEAAVFTPGAWMEGDQWIAGKGLPYNAGLM